MEDRSQPTTDETPSKMPTKRHWISQSTFVKPLRNNKEGESAMPELDLTAFEGHLEKMNTAAEMIRSQLLRSQDQLGREMTAIRKENQNQRSSLTLMNQENERLKWQLKEAEDKLARLNARGNIPAPVIGVSKPEDGSQTTLELSRAIRDVMIERRAQDLKWGQQNHRHGIRPSEVTEAVERKAKEVFSTSQTIGNLSWQIILEEEIAELFNSAHIEDIRAEAIQVAAVAVAMAESLDRNGK